ncbi:MAG: hypothetical protein GVY11_02380 [Gammaproteobacteria bacterium]|jgi:hypothetical protein|nr:hypothetical protein [Gammaproteobacteria bacterium]
MSDAFEELAELWARRDRLDESEWTRLYGLVIDFLASSPPPDEERSLSSSKEAARAWRDSFFTDKVLMPATAGNAAMSRELTPGGLPHFYRNYLRDQLRKIKRRPEYQGYEGAEEDLADSQPLGDEASPVDAAVPAAGPDGSGQCGGEPGDDLGLDVERVRSSAAEFLQDAEDWVVIYLALHFCHGRDRLPLSKIHQQFQIPSYHYKARELGIAPPRGGYENFEDFGETMIGRWLADCGVALDPERMETIRQAFDLLCLAAFREAGQRGLADFGEEGR